MSTESNQTSEEQGSDGSDQFRQMLATTASSAGDDPALIDMDIEISDEDTATTCTERTRSPEIPTTSDLRKKAAWDKEVAEACRILDGGDPDLSDAGESEPATPKREWKREENQMPGEPIKPEDPETMWHNLPLSPLILSPSVTQGFPWESMTRV